MRSITAALQTHFNQTVTKVGYLVQWNLTAQVVRWCNLSNPPPADTTSVSYNGYPWGRVFFDITGLSFQPDTDPRASLEVNNADNAIMGLFQNEILSDCTVDVYQFSPSCLSAGDAPQMATFAIAGFQCGLEKATIDLISYGSLNAFSPRRRIDAFNGFNYALPEGTQVPWGNEIFVLQGESVV